MKKLLFFVLIVGFCSPALAGVRYTMHLEMEEAGRHTDVVQNSWLQAGKAKLFFEEGIHSESEFEADRFGAIAYSIDPVSRRATRIVVGKQEKRPAVAIENIITTKIHQEIGPVIKGHPTTHYTFSSKFDYVENGFTQQGTMTHEVWVASDLADVDLMSWMMFEYRLRQDHGIESLFREVSTLGRGLPLAYDGLALIQTGDGNIRVIRVGATVDSLENVNVDPSVFTASSNTYEVVAGGQ